jgi:hypothetical protein
MVNGTGLGNPTKELINNTGKLPDAMLEEATRLFFSKYGGCDFEVKEDCILVGIEPAYQYEHLKMICISLEKGSSYFQQGKALGDYGSNVVATSREYRSYKRNSKFTRFVDKWHYLTQSNRKSND